MFIAIDITKLNNLLSIVKAKEVEQMQAYCMKCRAKREMKDTKSITMKNGRPATQGVCPVCGTKMFRIGKG
jgi:Zn finger protein HypA/HybF involved in hydrogenase expression